MEIIKYLLITLIVLLFFATISYILYDNIYDYIHNDTDDINDDKKSNTNIIYNNRYLNPIWRLPWRRPYNKTCPNGCVFTGDKHDSESGYACPYGGKCFSNNCCKYDFQCKKCGRKLE